MWNTIRTFVIAHSFGTLLILSGWYVSLSDIALNCVNRRGIFSPMTTLGLLMIFSGAYIPELWTRIALRKKN